MIQFLRMYRTSIGTKIVMAVTGLLLFLWIIAHMLGNLLVFAGQDAMNAYAFSLKELGPSLWIVRIGLLALFIVHILSAVLVWRSNRGARTEAYSEYDPRWATYAGRTMMVSGVLVLVYVLYHLMHFTFGWIDPAYMQLLDGRGRHDVYAMVVHSFSNVIVSAVYIVSMGLLAFHLSHGVTSLFQTLGWHHPSYNPLIKRLGPILSVVIAIGFILVPLGVLTGVVALP